MKRIITLCLICVFATLLFYACNDNVVVFQSGTAKVRVFNAQIKSSAVSVTIDSQLIVKQLESGIISDPIDVRTRYGRVFEIRNPDDATLSGRIAINTYTLADNQSYTLVVRGVSITDFLRPIIDTSISPFKDKAALRVINSCEETFIRVHVDTVMLTPFVTDAQTITPLYPALAGMMRVSAINDDTKDTIATEMVNLTKGACYHLFLYDIRNGAAQKQQMKIITVQ